MAQAQLMRKLPKKHGNKPITGEPMKITIASYEGTAPMRQFTRSCIHAFALYEMYNPNWANESDSNPADTLGAVLTILSTYAPLRSTIFSELPKALQECNIQVKKVSPKLLSEMDVVTSGRRKALATIMGLRDSTNFLLEVQVVALSILIFIGQNAPCNDREKWFRKKWMIIAKILKFSIDVDEIKLPSLRSCRAVYETLYVNRPVRSIIFKAMRALAITTENPHRVAFERIVQDLRWADMLQIPLILYLTSKNPEVLGFPEFDKERAAMSIALNALKPYSPEDRPYVLLLFPNTDFQPFDSDCFPYFMAAAYAILSQCNTNSGFNEVNSKYSKEFKDFQAKVISHFRNKNSNGSLLGASSYASNQSELKTVEKPLKQTVGTSTKKIPHIHNGIQAPTSTFGKNRNLQGELLNSVCTKTADDGIGMWGEIAMGLAEDREDEIVMWDEIAMGLAEDREDEIVTWDEIAMGLAEDREDEIVMWDEIAMGLAEDREDEIVMWDEIAMGLVEDRQDEIGMWDEIIAMGLEEDSQNEIGMWDKIVMGLEEDHQDEIGMWDEIAIGHEEDREDEIVTWDEIAMGLAEDRQDEIGMWDKIAMGLEEDSQDEIDDLWY